MGQLLPNAWGLFDVLGNLREWVWDIAQSNTSGNYQNQPYTRELIAGMDPVWPEWLPARERLPVYGSGTWSEVTYRTGSRTIRGGGWKDQPSALRAARRVGQNANSGANDIGFRLVRSVP